jgi:glycosyltransferase involved in cell wall biosynthesis
MKTNSQPTQQISAKFIQKYHNIHFGKRCVIIGNGPSLNKMDLSFLKNEFTFATNRIYLGFEKFDFSPSYYVCVNPLVIEQSVNEILAIPCPKFLSKTGEKFFKVGPKIHFLEPMTQWTFSDDPSKGIAEGWTVTYVCMQLAAYMGFSEIYLIGVDHNYAAEGRPNQEVVASGQDPNHFSPDYFNTGTHWHLPDLDRSELSYHMANLFVNNHDKKIYDATLDGKLKEFPKVDYRSVFLNEKKTGAPEIIPLILPVETVIDNSIKQPYKVTAITSTYRGERFLRECLSDLEAQTIADETEIVIVDSASEQNEKDIVLEFQSKYKNIVYVRTEEKETIYAAWNRAINHAHGKYITNANVDDRHDRTAYEKMSKFLDTHAEFALVYADVAITTKENARLVDAPISGFYLLSDFDPEILFKICYVGPQPMWRKDLHERYGLFDPFYTSAGDYEYWLRISKSEKFYHLPETLGLYFLSQYSAEHRNTEISKMEQFNAIKRHLPSQFKSNNELLSKYDIGKLVTDKISEILFQVGDRYRKSEFAETLDCLNQALIEFPFHPVLSNIKGMLLLRSGNFEEARKVFAAIQVHYPAYTPAALNHAISLSYIGRMPEAIWLVEAIIVSSPKYLPALKARIQLYFKAGQDKKAVESSKKYLEKVPGDLEVRSYLADYFSKKNEIRTATSLYEIVFSETPDYLAVQEDLLSEDWVRIEDQRIMKISVMERFNLIVNSKDVVKSLKGHEDWLDEDLKNYVLAKIAEAQNQQLTEVVTALTNLKVFIEQVLELKK